MKKSKETIYLLDFGREEKYFGTVDVAPILALGDEVGKLLWTHIKNLAE